MSMRTQQRPWAAYARISVDKDESASIEGQRQVVERWAKAYGHKLEWFVDEGISGSKSVRRPQRDELERRLAAGDFAGVVVKAVDRLARNLRDFVRLADTASTAGVSVVVVETGIDTGTDSGRMMMEMLASFAAFEARQISARQKVSQEIRRQQNRALGQAPYGFRNVKEADGTWRRIDHDEAKAVKAMTRWLVAGASLADTAAKADAAGYTPRRTPKWSPESLSQTLRNPSLNGQRKRGDDVERGADGRPIRDKDLAILDNQTWAKLQAALDHRSKHRFAPKRHEPLLLAPVTFCGSCGGPMCRSGANKDFHVYRCSNGMHGKCIDDGKMRLGPVTIGVQKLETFVDDFLQLKEGVTAMVERTVDDPALTVELDEVNETIERLVRSIGGATASETESLMGQLVALKDQQAMLLHRLETEQVEVVEDLGFAPARAWADGDDATRRELVPLFFHSIHVFKAKHHGQPADERVQIRMHDGTKQGYVAWFAGMGTLEDNWRGSEVA